MFNRIQLECYFCGTLLTGGGDTFGDVGQECCQTCFWEYQDVYEYAAQFDYGLAPHYHDTIITGSVIGGTVFEPLPEPAEDGRYWIENRNAWFSPDPECSTMGFYDFK